MAKTKELERITRPLTAEEKAQHCRIREQVMREFPPAEKKRQLPSTGIAAEELTSGSESPGTDVRSGREGSRPPERQRGQKRRVRPEYRAVQRGGHCEGPWPHTRVGRGMTAKQAVGPRYRAGTVCQGRPSSRLHVAEVDVTVHASKMRLPAPVRATDARWVAIWRGREGWTADRCAFGLRSVSRQSEAASSFSQPTRVPYRLPHLAFEAYERADRTQGRLSDVRRTRRITRAAPVIHPLPRTPPPPRVHPLFRPSGFGHRDTPQRGFGLSFFRCQPRRIPIRFPWRRWLRVH